jgi:hypothetical protein
VTAVLVLIVVTTVGIVHAWWVLVLRRARRRRRAEIRRVRIARLELELGMPLSEPEQLPRVQPGCAPHGMRDCDWCRPKPSTPPPGPSGVSRSPDGRR